MNILVTGGLGYIGSHVSLALAELGFNVHIIDKEKRKRKNLDKTIQETSSNIFIHYCDIREEKELNLLFERIEINTIFHFAGLKSVPESFLYPQKYFKTNVQGTDNLLNAFNRSNKGLKKFIFSSSASVYGKPIYLPVDEKHPTSPMSPYGEMKVIVEEKLKQIFEEEGNWSFISLRYFNPVGDKLNYFYNQRSPNKVKNLFENISDVLKGKEETLKIYGRDYDTPDKTCIRDFIHIDDLISGHISAMNFLNDLNKPSINTFNLGTGKGYSILEAISVVENVYNVKLNYDYFDRREGDISISYADISRANNILKWQAKHGLEAMVKLI